MINAVMREQAKSAERLEPKGNVVGTGAEVSPVMGSNTTGGKKEPNLSIMVKQAEHGKPVTFLIGDGVAVRLAIGLRVEDGGKSERRSVIDRIGI
ncbi:MAG: hypothetical protein ACXW0L_03480 [Methylosarcina sp.]